MNERINKLKNIDWDFSDYFSLKYPTDINSIHWYPGSFVPPIPSVLIETLTNQGDVVLDTFSGSGVTLIEASRLKRNYIGIDQNPNAIDISKAKILALSETDYNWYNELIEKILELEKISNIDNYCKKNLINQDTKKWFENETLRELLSIHQFIVSNVKNHELIILKTIFSSILNRCCSQRDHYTYVTDNCFPKEMIYKDAISEFVNQLELIGSSVKNSKEQYRRVFDSEWTPLKDGRIEFCDARELSFIKDNEIDIVVTSPPYLGVNDYVRSMKLTFMFFKNDLENKCINDEIGARRKRGRKNAYEEYIKDMRTTFSEIKRVLKKNSYFCLIIGQGRGKVNKDNTIQALLDILKKDFYFSVKFQEKRKIKFRRIQVPGVANETIIVLQNKD